MPDATGWLSFNDCRGNFMIWTVLATIAAVIAAVIPLMVWSQNKREQSTGSKLLAQLMITPIAATQVEIAKFRCAVVPPDGDQSYLVNVLNSHEARKDLASRASRILNRPWFRRHLQAS